MINTSGVTAKLVLSVVGLGGRIHLGSVLVMV